MKKLYLAMAASAFCFLNANGEWIDILKLSTYQVGDGETELQAEGWTFQDENFFQVQDCDNGTIDCTGVREIVEAPYSPPPGASDKALLIRPAPADSVGAYNAGSNSRIALPTIPIGETATVFFRWASESAEGWRLWGIGPETIPGYGDMGPILNFAPIWDGPRMGVYRSGSGYIPSYEGGEETHHETWYEVWLHITNNPTAVGGQIFQIYLKGPGFPEPTLLPNYVDGADFWLFRQGTVADKNLAGLLIGAGTGSPDDFAGYAATFFNAIYVNPGVFTTECPDCQDGETWDGKPVIDGWVDTDDFLGWMWVGGKPWVFNLKLNKYIYLPESGLSQSGGWSYIPK